MQDACRVAPVAQDTGQPVGNRKPPLGFAQQQQAAIRRQLTIIDTNCELLGRDGWQVEAERRILRRGCGARCRYAST